MMNGTSLDGEEDESTEDGASVNGLAVPSRDGRSASATSSRTAVASTLGRTSAKAVHTHRHHSPRHSSAQSQPGTSGSPPSARETFLNYFFGQNGPGPISGSSLDRSSAGHITSSGRDLSGADPSLQSGLMAVPARDGNTAAFDMKSLGKHIEAVSCPLITALSAITRLSEPFGQHHRSRPMAARI